MNIMDIAIVLPNSQMENIHTNKIHIETGPWKAYSILGE